MSRFGVIRNLALGAVLGASMTMGGLAVSLAQDEAPTASHPIHIHTGTCDELDPNPLAPLPNMEPRLNEDPEDNQAVGALTAPTVLITSEDDIDLAWDDMLAEAHAINVHLSDEEVQTYIACGDIGGIVVDDQLVIALQPVNDSGYAGVVILTVDGDGNVDVPSVYLFQPVTDTEVPEATPAA